MDNWIDELARALGEEPLTSAETTQLLDAARDVAHRVERKMTPLSTFVIGCAVGREIAGGADRRPETLRRDRLRPSSTATRRCPVRHAPREPSERAVSLTKHGATPTTFPVVGRSPKG